MFYVTTAQNAVALFGSNHLGNYACGELYDDYLTREDYDRIKHYRDISQLVAVALLGSIPNAWIEEHPILQPFCVLWPAVVGTAFLKLSLLGKPIAAPSNAAHNPNITPVARRIIPAIRSLCGLFQIECGVVLIKGTIFLFAGTFFHSMDQSRTWTWGQ